MLKKKYKCSKHQQNKPGKLNNKAQLFGSEMLLWMYRLMLVTIFLFGLVLITAKLRISFEQNNAALLFHAVSNCAKYELQDDIEQCLNAINTKNFFVMIKKKDYTVEYGDTTLKIYCEIKKKAKIDIACINQAMPYADIFLAVK